MLRVVILGRRHCGCLTENLVYKYKDLRRMLPNN